MHIKMCIHYSLIRSLASYKVCLCFIVLSVMVCTVGYVYLFHRDQIFVDFVSFLSMIIYEALYTLSWCLSYNICSTWFLDIRISTCFLEKSLLLPFTTIYILWNLCIMKSLGSINKCPDYLDDLTFHFILYNHYFGTMPGLYTVGVQLAQLKGFTVN